MMRTIASILLLSVAVGAEQQRDARVPAIGTAEITGVIVGADGRQPIRRAIVTISGGPLTDARSAITDDAGRFAFRKLPAGTFAVAARKSAYLTAEHGSPLPGRPGSRVTLASGARRAVTIRMFKGAVISGHLLLPSGAPAKGVRVVAVNMKLDQRERTTEPVITNDLGEYRIYGLMPGEYIIAATPTAGGSGDIGARPAAELDMVLARLAARLGPAPHATREPEAAPIPPAPVVGYAPIYFPGTPLLSDAQPVRVAAEDDRGSVGFTISRVPVARIAGTISGADNPAQVQLAMVAELADLRFAGGPGLSIGMTATPPNAAGEFEFSNVPPGRYQVIARGRDGSNEPLFARADVDVRGQDVRGLSLALRPGGRISGIVMFDSGGAIIPTDLSRFRMAVTPLGDRTTYQLGGMRIGNILSDVPSVAITDESEFRIAGIGPATYTLTCTIPPDLASTWQIRSALVDGRDLLDSVITGPDVVFRQVTVILSDKRTELAGTLSSAAGQPASEYYVVAFSTDRAHWRTGSRRSLAARPATDGRFVLSDLPAGEYFLAALTDLDPDTWQEPAFLEQVAPAAIKVKLAEGEKRVQDLRIQ